MKTAAFIITSLLAASALVLSSCQKENGRIPTGEAVRFTAGSGFADTKAAYSGQTNADGTIERIDWQTGDLLRIYCAQASEPSVKYADYKVKSVDTPVFGSEISTAHIELDGSTTEGIGLRWGIGDHTFYSAFPSPAASGITTAISGKTVSAALPATQAVVGTISKTGTSWKAVPNLKNMLMTAKTTCTEATMPEEDEVFLSYTALTTAIQFTIKNDTGAELPLTSVQLISGNGKTTAEPVISGAFSVDLDQTGIAAGTEVQPFAGNDFKIKYLHSYPQCSATTATSTDMAARTLTISVGTATAPLKLAVDDTFTFTFFLTPIHDFRDLTFKFTKPDGSWMSTRLGYTDGDGIFFPRHKKSSVTGLLVPDGAKWTVKYGPTVENWEPSGSEIGPMPPVDEALTVVTSWDSGIEGNLALKPLDYKFKLVNAANNKQTFTNTTSSDTKTVAVTSSINNDGVESDAEWLIKSVKVGSADAQTVNATSFSNIEGLSARQVNNGHNLEITASGRTAVNPGTNDYWRNQNPVRTDNLDWSPADWSDSKAKSSAPLDLSKFDFRTEATDKPMTTANCYIIRHAGTYKIPLVYGNAIVNDATNEQAYKPTMASGGNSAYFLSQFHNHLGNGITSPFIENNKKTTSSYINAQAAAIVWQDKDAVIKDVKIVSGASTGKAGSYTTSNVRYLQFTVDPEKICQNNAIIAIKDGTSSSASIIWSWHIWTTNNPALLDEPIPVTNRTPQVYNFFPLYNLGWIDPSTYPTRDKVIITLAQESSNKEIEIEVRQASIPAAASSGVHYQFGRKDPMCTTDSPSQGNFKKDNSDVPIATTIKNPGTVYYSDGDWVSGTSYHNLWTGKLSVVKSICDQNDNLIKTVYDPSPAGYKVPAPNAFSGFTTTGNDEENSNYFNVDKTKGFKYGWSFYTDASKSSIIYFPTSGDRQSTTGGLEDIDTWGCYWSVMVYGKDAAYGLKIRESQVKYKYESSRSYAFSVRPVTE